MERFIEHYTRYKAHADSLELEIKMHVCSFHLVHVTLHHNNYWLYRLVLLNACAIPLLKVPQTHNLGFRYKWSYGIATCCINSSKRYYTYF